MHKDTHRKSREKLVELPFADCRLEQPHLAGFFVLQRLQLVANGDRRFVVGRELASDAVSACPGLPLGCLPGGLSFGQDLAALPLNVP